MFKDASKAIYHFIFEQIMDYLKLRLVQLQLISVFFRAINTQPCFYNCKTVEVKASHK